MKTLTDLKKAWSIGTKVLLVSRFGKEVNEEREVIHTQSNSLAFKTPSKPKMWLDYPKASLLEFDGVNIKIYGTGKRPLTPEEQKIKDGWEAIRNKEAEMNDAMSDGSGQFYREKGYYRSHDAEYLIGHTEQRGMCFDYNTGLVRDNSVKGELELVYKLIQ